MLQEPFLPPLLHFGATIKDKHAGWLSLVLTFHISFSLIIKSLSSFVHFYEDSDIPYESAPRPLSIVNFSWLLIAGCEATGHFQYY